MRILILSTIAGRLDRVAAVLDEVRDEPFDALVVLGSLASGTDKPQVAFYRQAFALIGSRGLPVLVVPGERDFPLAELAHAIAEQGYAGAIRLIHGLVEPLNDHDIVAGLGGRIMSEVDPNDPFALSVKEVEAAFAHMDAYNPLFQHAYRRILLFASPLFDERDDEPRAQSSHAQGGLRPLLRAYQPYVVCTHSAKPSYALREIEGVAVLELGSLEAGSYALLELDQLDATFKWLATTPPAVRHLLEPGSEMVVAAPELVRQVA